jgi:hypothetical protein
MFQNAMSTLQLKRKRMIRFVEIYQEGKYCTTASGASNSFSLREVYVNPKHVVCLREDDAAKKYLNEGRMPEELDDRQVFTKIHLNRGQSGIDITVVGDPNIIEEKLKSQRTILRG